MNAKTYQAEDYHPTRREIIAQELLREYIHTDISEDEWDRLCDARAGMIVWKPEPGPFRKPRDESEPARIRNP